MFLTLFSSALVQKQVCGFVVFLVKTLKYFKVTANSFSSTENQFLFFFYSYYF